MVSSNGLQNGFDNGAGKGKSTVSRPRLVQRRRAVGYVEYAYAEAEQPRTKLTADRRANPVLLTEEVGNAAKRATGTSALDLTNRHARKRGRLFCLRLNDPAAQIEETRISQRH